ncbi:MAG TPA: threonine synthase [Rectinemataceae bacterium]|nr:threonine synthase [Rectinemataceae bacterium]
MLLRSTRSDSPPLGADRALLEGLAPDGGLYVPLSFPILDPALLRPETRPYVDIAYATIAPWFDELPAAELRAAVARAAATFDDPLVAPLAMAGDQPVLELFHGPTLAFKDLALTLFGDLLAMARKKVGLREELLVIVATSGDTGSAALSGLENREGIKVVAIYPAKGVSEVQRRQMTTRSASNCLVLGIDGNFDDAQRTAKRLLSEAGPRKAILERGFSPCSANSINIGRLAPQVAYYVHAFRELLARGFLDPEGLFDVAVPSGNFGNVLAARYAKQMGAGIGSFLVATNRNRVLADFLDAGVYDRNRAFHVTTSPSMDILVSSNLERVIFEAAGRNSERTAALMADLATRGRYELRAGERVAFADFRGSSADEKECAEEIRHVFDTTGYLLDPHTATASAALRKAGKLRPTLLVATASPFKFAGIVSAAIGLEPRGDEFEAVEALAERAGLAVPRQLTGLREAVECHRRVVAPERIEAEILAWLSGSE